MVPENLKGYLSVTGAVIIHIVLGSVYTWSNINSYFTSYLKFHDSPNIKLVDGYFLMPIIVFISNISMYFGPKIDAKLGVKKCLLITIMMVVLSHLILLLWTKLSVVYVAMIIFGVSNGISYMSVMKNCWLYFPQSKGLISGIILFGYGLSAFFFTWLSDSIINPTYEKANSNTGLFDEIVANRMYIFILYLNIILDIMGVIGYLIIFDFSHGYTIEEFEKIKNQINNVNVINIDDNDNNNSNYNNNNSNNNNSNNNNNNSNNNNSNSNIIEDTIRSNPMKEIFIDIQVWQIIIMNFCTLYYCYMCTNTNRSFGQLNSISEKLLANLSKCFALINGGGRLIWGILFDKFGFKILYILLVITEIFISFGLYFVGQYPFIYFLFVIITAFLLAGNIALMTPLYPKIYGITYATKVNGICVALYGFTCLLGPIISKFFINEKKDYKILYFSGTFFAFLSLITIITFKETPFNYINQKNESIKEENIEKEVINRVGRELLIQEN